MTQAGGMLVLAALIGMPGCSAPTGPGVEPSSMEVLQRPDTLVAPGAAFDTVAIRIRDAAGQPLAGVLVEWSADGEITAFAPRSDAAGIARARWLLPGRSVEERAASPRTGPSGRFAATASVPGLGVVTIPLTARAFTVDTLHASDYYGCGLRQGELWCWGTPAPLHPAPGRGTRRVALPDGVVPRSVITGFAMLCVLDQFDRPHCAVEGFGDRFEPILGAPALRDVVVMHREMCGVALGDGSVWCWRSWYGTGHGQTAYRVQEGPFVSLAAGWHSLCGLSPTGAAYCWGGNARGQLGDGTTTDREQAVTVSGDLKFLALAAGAEKSCGSEVNGAVWCWGQLRLGVQSSVPVRFDAPGVTGPDLRVGFFGELYVLSDNRLGIFGPSGEAVTGRFADHLVRQLAVGVGACLRNLGNEVHCSWHMMQMVIGHSRVPSEPIPVPPPKNGW